MPPSNYQTKRTNKRKRYVPLKLHVQRWNRAGKKQRSNFSDNDANLTKNMASKLETSGYVSEDEIQLQDNAGFNQPANPSNHPTSIGSSPQVRTYSHAGHNRHSISSNSKKHCHSSSVTIVGTDSTCELNSRTQWESMDYNNDTSDDEDEKISPRQEESKDRNTEKPTKNVPNCDESTASLVVTEESSRSSAHDDSINIEDVQYYRMESTDESNLEGKITLEKQVLTRELKSDFKCTPDSDVSVVTNEVNHSIRYSKNKGECGSKTFGNTKTYRKELPTSSSSINVVHEEGVDSTEELLISDSNSSNDVQILEIDGNLSSPKTEDKIDVKEVNDMIQLSNFRDSIDFFHEDGMVPTDVLAKSDNCSSNIDTDSSDSVITLDADDEMDLQKVDVEISPIGMLQNDVFLTENSHGSSDSDPKSLEFENDFVNCDEIVDGGPLIHDVMFSCSSLPCNSKQDSSEEPSNTQLLMKSSPSLNEGELGDSGLKAEGLEDMFRNPWLMDHLNENASDYLVSSEEHKSCESTNVLQPLSLNAINPKKLKKPSNGPSNTLKVSYSNWIENSRFESYDTADMKGIDSPDSVHTDSDNRQKLQFRPFLDEDQHDVIDLTTFITDEKSNFEKYMNRLDICCKAKSSYEDQMDEEKASCTKETLQLGKSVTVLGGFKHKTASKRTARNALKPLKYRDDDNSNENNENEESPEFKPHKKRKRDLNFSQDIGHEEDETSFLTHHTSKVSNVWSTDMMSSATDVTANGDDDDENMVLAANHEPDSDSLKSLMPDPTDTENHGPVTAAVRSQSIAVTDSKAPQTSCSKCPEQEMTCKLLTPLKVLISRGCSKNTLEDKPNNSKDGQCNDVNSSTSDPPAPEVDGLDPDASPSMSSSVTEDTKVKLVDQWMKTECNGDEYYISPYVNLDFFDSNFDSALY